MRGRRRADAGERRCQRPTALLLGAAAAWLLNAAATLGGGAATALNAAAASHLGLSLPRVCALDQVAP